VVSRVDAGRDVTAYAQTVVVPRVRGYLARLEDARPVYVLSALLVVEWLTILAVGLTVRRNGWIYYQGGDQLWHWVTSWLLGQGRLTHTSVGYAWSIVLLPFAIAAGPNLVSALPAILLFNVLVLMPIAFFSIYGIGARIGGRLFGYWTAALWIVVPLVGIKYADAGYHQRYTELLLPQSLGLSVMSDFPAMVVLAAAAYFTLRAAQDDMPADAIVAGLLAGVALGIKPSNAPFLVGAGLALLVAKRRRGILAFGLGLVPSVVALTVWKARGEGNVPLFSNSASGAHLAAGPHTALVAFAGLNLHRYVSFDWHWFQVQQLDSLRDHFWSARVLEWIAIAGAIGLFRRSRPAGLLFAGWLFATVFVKWGSPGHGSTVDNSDILRQTIFTIPAALMLIAGTLLLFPRLPQRLPRPARRPWGTHRLRIGLIAGLVTIFGVVPAALAAALPTLKSSDRLAYYVQNGVSLSAPFTIDKGWHVQATVHGGSVHLTWPVLHSVGGHMNYVVLRSHANQSIECDATGGGAQCRLLGFVVDYTNSTSFVEKLPPGTWEYRLAAKASWVDDATQGDIYVAGPPLDVTTR
jgi:hypothetical protein